MTISTESKANETHSATNSDSSLSSMKTSQSSTATPVGTVSSTNTTTPITQATEKPSHYTYLKGFRVDQCSLFLQHKCTQHRPYTCFYWHFKNQRRRRPLRKRDGTFNYNPDVYCDKYDEQTGICSNGDECIYVHRNAGDTEKRYHLRYYKTATCIHETDSKGNCAKNGAHCAFAHGANDMRPAVYDIREIQIQQHQQHQLQHDKLNVLHNNENNSSSSSSSSSSSHSSSSSTSSTTTTTSTNDLINEKALNLSTCLEKERILNEDPKWNDTNYVLLNYKTEQCKRPPRLCRQGFACPQYHNARDKRRNPSMFKYRSTPCPNVKQGDDWLEPTVCENGDSCKYCHSRTEQQFHPEIYKSSKCNDMISTGYCPRGPFCAFAHIEQELKNQRAHSTSESSSSEYTLENFISNVLPSSTNKENELNINKTETNENTMATSATTLTNEINVQGNAELSESYQQHINLVKNAKLNEDLVIGMQQPLSCSIGSFGEENDMSLMSQQQQQQFISYNKAIGSEREIKPKAATTAAQIQLLANKTNTSSLTLLNAARSSSPYNLNESDSQQLSSVIKQQQQQQQVNLNILGGLNSTQSNSSSSSSSPSPISSATSVNNNTSISLNRTNSISTATATSGPNQSLLNKLSSQNAANLSLSGLTLNQPQQSMSQQQQTLQMAQLQQQQQQQSQNLLNFSTSSLNSNSVDLEKEKLKQDLLKKSEMCSKLEALCLQYRQWVEKLTIESNEWKAKYVRCESEKKNLELQFLNKFSLEQTLGSNRPNSFNFNGNVGSSLNNSASNQ